VDENLAAILNALTLSENSSVSGFVYFLGFKAA